MYGAREHLLRLVLEEARETEICDLDLAVLHVLGITGQQNVPRVQVAVHDSLRVQVIHCLSDLPHQHRRVSLGVEALVHNLLQHLAARDVLRTRTRAAQMQPQAARQTGQPSTTHLHYNVELLGRIEDLVQRHDIGVLDTAQRIAFRLEDLVAALRVDAALLDHLDRVRLPCLPVRALLHLCEVPGADRVLDDIVPAPHARPQSGRGAGERGCGCVRRFQAGNGVATSLPRRSHFFISSL